jgi:AcrR family transcriptional regulator
VPRTAARALSTPRRTRKDARRNYAQIVAVASAAFAVHGADASLEAIAREAEVGPATLRRHFPTRYHLLEAVFSHRVAELVERTRHLAEEPDPAVALVLWLRSVGSYMAASRGLAESLMQGADQQLDVTFDGETCYAMVLAAGDELVQRAHAFAVLRAGVTTEDLITIMYAFCIAADQAHHDAGIVDRLLEIALHGIFSTQPRTPG